MIVPFEAGNDFCPIIYDQNLGYVFIRTVPRCSDAVSNLRENQRVDQHRDGIPAAGAGPRRDRPPKMPKNHRVIEVTWAFQVSVMEGKVKIFRLRKG